jgi:hypothetical protein
MTANTDEIAPLEKININLIIIQNGRKEIKTGRN